MLCRDPEAAGVVREAAFVASVPRVRGATWSSAFLTDSTCCGPRAPPAR